MNNIQFLETNDFKIANSDKGPVLLCLGCPQGFSFVLFYHSSCQHSMKRAIPDFRALPTLLSGCQFGMVNVGLHPNIVRMSAQTISVVDRVPSFIFFVNGIPFRKLCGPHPIEELKQFIMSVVSTLQPQQFQASQIKTKFNAARNKHEIPPYSLGVPKGIEEDETSELYFEYNEAYEQGELKGNWRDINTTGRR